MYGAVRTSGSVIVVSMLIVSGSAEPEALDDLHLAAMRDAALDLRERREADAFPPPACRLPTGRPRCRETPGRDPSGNGRPSV